MKIENQVCTLEQAKKLKELGIECKSLFQWRDYSMLKDNRIEPLVSYERVTVSHASVMQVFNAFTVAELGVMIGKGTHFSERHWQWLLDCVNSGLSGTVAYNTVALAGFVLTHIEAYPSEISEVNKRLNTN